MIDHSPEPWSCIDDACSEVGLRNRDGSIRVWTMSYVDDSSSRDRAMANARRICACVNALAGVPIAALESRGGQTFEHGPEPWTARDVLNLGDLFTLDDRDGKPCGWASSHDKTSSRASAAADGRRIVACVNACAGVPTAELEAMGVTISPEEAETIKNA